MVIDKTTLNNIATGLGIVGFTTSTLASSGVLSPAWAGLINAFVTLGLGYVTQKPAAPSTSTTVPTTTSTIPVVTSTSATPVVSTFLPETDGSEVDY